LLLALAYAAFILLATLLPGPPLTEPSTPFCIVCGSRGLADFALNILFFVPLGFLLRRPLGWRRALLAGVLLSGGVELAQLAIPGRYSTLGDFVTNSAGTGLGLILARARLTVLLRPAPRVGRLLATAWTTLVVAGLVAAALLFQPSIPRRPLYGQWTHDLGRYEVYGGRVLGAWIGGRAAPDGRLKASGPMRDSLQRGTPIRVRFAAGPPPPDLAPIFSVYDDHQKEVLLIGADGPDLVMTLRRRADDARLDRPEMRVRGALEGVAAGDTVEIDARPVRPGSYRLAVRSAVGSVASAVRGPTLGRSWSLLLFSGCWPGWWIGVLDLVWLAVLAVPVGWWSPRVALLGVCGGAYLAALGMVPLLIPILPTPLVQYLAAGFGLLAGWWGSRRHAPGPVT